MPINIFISYSSENQNKLEALLRIFKKKENLTPIVVADQRLSLQTLSEKVINCFSKSDYFISILTKESINNQWVNQELGYATAIEDRIKIVPIVEKGIMDDLKGFINRNVDLPYTYVGSDEKRKEAANFRKCCNLLLDDIKSAEQVAGMETSISRTDIDQVKLYDYKKEDIDVNVKIKKSTKYILKVKVSNAAQTFHAYYQFMTNKNEVNWVGFTNFNGPPFIRNNEYTVYIGEEGREEYVIEDRVLETIKKRFPGLQGKSKNIIAIRFRGDKTIQEPITFHCGISD